MKKKNVALLSGLLGLGGLFVTGVVVKKQLDEKRRQRILAEVRRFFDTFGTIAVLYINDFESTLDCVKGGVVFDDDVTFYFEYRQGEIDYRVAE